jgi:Fe-S-cluster containining protein
MRTEANTVSQRTLRPVNEFADEIKNAAPYVYRMKKTANGKCVFLSDDMCSIYAARPLVCRFYPFELRKAENNTHAFSYTAECPCIGKGPELKRRYFEKLFAESIKLVKKNAKES